MILTASFQPTMLPTNSIPTGNPTTANVSDSFGMTMLFVGFYYSS